MPAGPCSRWTTRKSSCSPLLALRRRGVDVGQRLVDDVYGPHENQRVTSGSPASVEQRRRVLADGQAQGQRGTMQRDAGAAVRHPRQPTGARGRPRRRARGAARSAICSAATTRVVRRLAGRDRGAPARPRRTPTWIRGNVDRWAATEAPDGEPARSGVAGCRATARRRDRRRAGRAARERRPRRTARAPGTPRRRPTSPRSGPSPATTSDELLEGVDRPAARLRPLPRLRSTASAPHGIELVDPGRGRHAPRRRPPRRLGARCDDDGRIERRRVAYDHAASAARVREVADGAPWGEVIAGRIERARLA